MKRTVEVTILNQKYNIKTPLSEEELDAIVKILNEKMKKLEEFGGTVTTPKLAILAALHITAENYFAAKKIDNLINQVSEVC